MKLSSAGWPWNFSWFSLSRGQRSVDIALNMPIRGAYRFDGSVYVVDVAILTGGSLFACKAGSWPAFPNSRLISFVESKAITIYPMLLAQWLGIVGEVKPCYLRGRSARHFRSGDFYPMLVALGRVSRNAHGIVTAWPGRGFCLNLVERFDEVLGRDEEWSIRP